MKIYRCEFPGCNEYIPEDELKKVSYNNKTITICMFCDDGSFKHVNSGDNVDTIKKTEKIRRKRDKQDK